MRVLFFNESALAHNVQFFTAKAPLQRMLIAEQTVSFS